MKTTKLKAFLEILILKITMKKQDKTKIPQGLYCYSYKDKKHCPYYRTTGGPLGGIGGTYIKFFGDDAFLCDACKICGENEGLDYINEAIQSLDK